MTQQPTLFNWLSIIALGLIWGGTFMVVSIALEGYGPLTVACARVTLGAVALVGLMVVLQRPIPQLSGRLTKYLLMIGLLNSAIPFALLSWGQQFVQSAFAGIAMAAVALFVLPLAHIFSDERLTFRNSIGVGLGFAGAVVLIGPGLMRLGSGMEPWGQLACLGAAFSYAVASIMTRRCPTIDPIAMATAVLVVGAIALIPAMLVFEGLPAVAETRPTIAIILLGLIPTALAAWLRISTIRSAGSVFMAPVGFQVPVWSMIFGALVLNEDLPLRFFVALGLILTGLAISQWKNLRKIARL
jgi:drug/metabolite transporter (DMT)-like permease